jgi:hypothetical protein
MWLRLSFHHRTRIEVVDMATRTIVRPLPKSNAGMERLLLWLFPNRRGVFARCAVCGLKGDKSDMIHERAWGWFCSDVHRKEFEDRTRW